MAQARKAIVASGGEIKELTAEEHGAFARSRATALRRGTADVSAAGFRPVSRKDAVSAIRIAPPPTLPQGRGEPFGSGRCHHRRRRAARPRARHRTEAGSRRDICRDGRRSGIRARAGERSARLRDRGGGTPSPANDRCWDALATAAQPILDMTVTDSRLTRFGAAVYLSFAGEITPGEPFAHMVENRHSVASASKGARRGRRLGLTRRQRFQFRPHLDLLSGGDGAIQLVSKRSKIRHGISENAILLKGGGMRWGVISSHPCAATDRKLSARLLVAADGARSKLRERAGIKLSAGTIRSRRSQRRLRMSAIITAARQEHFSARWSHPQSCR